LPYQPHPIRPTRVAFGVLCLGPGSMDKLKAPVLVRKN
jgi:hypothetical protein